MPRLFLFCLVSSQLATVMARPFPVLSSFDSGATLSIAEAPALGALHVHSLLEHEFAGSPLSSHHGSHHSPFDRHFAGGKIIGGGGLAAAIIVAVFCYIRITKAKKPVVEEPKT
jgi:hypothetical protein